MYENQTFEAVLERMLERVPAGLDRREGSVIYDALSPAAAELAQMYAELETFLRLSFAETASGEYLERAVAWAGIKRRPASRAQLLGAFAASDGALLDIPAGSRFSLGAWTYVAVERLGAGRYRMESETAGSEGGRYFGALLPIHYMEGLARAELISLLIPGEDEESDDELRARYLETARLPATSGNRHHYAAWARQVPGVGGVRVFPLWDGPGTVKVVIADSEMRPATETLVEEVQQYIDPDPGKGEGQAPVGAAVTVAGAVGQTLHLRANVTLASGYGLQQVTDDFRKRLEDWRTGAAFQVSYASLPVIGSLLLATEGVLDYASLTLNGGTANVALADGEVPLIGNVELEV